MDLEPCTSSVVSKILERIVIENRLVTKAQHDFVSPKSCLSNLIETLDFITSSLVENHSVDKILLNFGTEFDLASHHRLFSKDNGIWCH